MERSASSRRDKNADLMFMSDRYVLFLQRRFADRLGCLRKMGAGSGKGTEVVEDTLIQTAR